MAKTELENIIVEKKDEEGVGKIILNREDAMNALDEKTYEDLWVAVEDVRTDEGMRAVVITGAGKAFCAGLDLKYGAKITGMSGVELRATMRKIQDTFRLERLEKPVIAAINGYALGNGCDLALACDFRIAAEEARFGMTYSQLGLIPDVGGTYRLTKLVGVSKAKELIFTGEMIDAKEAQRIGMVDKVVAGADLEPSAMQLAKKLAKCAPVAIGLAKMAINNAIDTDLKSALEYELYGQSLCFQTEDVKEGVKAKMEKREPVFKGK
jgi:enoyl-CoA hydratase